MVILLDPGHGADTPGKRSPDGLFREYRWNREVMNYIHLYLTVWGFDVRCLVEEERDISLKERVARINDICRIEGKDNIILLSIHSNAAGNGRDWQEAKGWSCYTTKGTTGSDRVAECLYDAFEKEFPERKIRKDMRDGDRDWEEDFYILKHSVCKAVLLENFFYDNREECSFLLDEKNKVRIARAVLEGIKKYTTI